MNGDFVAQDLRNMTQFGFIYADGTYSDEREPRGAILVPRRPSPSHKWDSQARRWVDTASLIAPPVPQPILQVEAPVALPTGKKEAAAVQPDANLGANIAEMLASTTTPEAGSV